MTNTAKPTSGKLLLRRIIGATAAAVTTAVVFTLAGYGDVGPDFRQFGAELLIGFASYLPIALLLHWAIRWDNIWCDIVFVSLFGSAMSFLLALVFLEGQNGIPAYVARITRENSWQPLLDLTSDGIDFLILAIVITLPVSAFAVWLWQVVTKVRARDVGV
jgi:hypothetical protein